jgi:hypothetical protein
VYATWANSKIPRGGFVSCPLDTKFVNSETTEF